MDIQQVDISGFGRWSKQHFDFQSGLQVILGQNESGKSTLRAFIVGILFGFPSKKGKTNTYDPRDGSRYGGSLTVRFASETVKITRLGRTQSQLTITRLADQTRIAEPEKWLADQLAPLNREVFDAIFNFSQQDLAEITQLKAVDLQKLLLNIGAVGSAQWLTVADDLDKQADKQFAQRPTGKRPLNQATKHYFDTLAQVQQKATALPDFIAGEAAVMADQQRVAEAKAAVLSLTAQVKQHEQVQQQYDVYTTAVALKTKMTQAGPHVSDADLLALQEQTSAIKLHQSALETLQQAQDPKQVAATPDAFEFETTLAQAQHAVTQLQEKLAAREKLLSAQRQLQAQFEDGVLPEPLNPTEKQQLTRRSSEMVWLMASLVVGVLGFLVTKPAVLLAVVPAGLAFWQYKSHQRQVAAILARYGHLTVDEVLTLQKTLQQQPATKQKLSGLNIAIADLQTAIMRQLKPVATHFNVTLHMTDLAQSVVELQHRYEQQKLTAQHDFMALSQQQQQRVEAIAFHQQQLDQAREAQQNLFAQYHVSDMADIEALKQQELSQTRLRQRYDDLMRQIQPDVLAQLEQIKDRDTLQGQLSALQQQLQAAQQRLFACQAALSDHQAQQAHLTSNDQFIAMQQALADEETALIEQFGVYIAEKLTSQWITVALQRASQNRFPKMQTLATQYFKRLTHGRYHEMTFSASELLVTRADQQQFTVTELSTGTQEQLYIALRLALSRVIADIVSVPILIDDGFVNFDPQRKQTMIALLQDIAQQQQIIYFTTAWPDQVVESMIKL